MPNTQFELIADRVEAIPVVARWHFEQWGDLVPDSSFEKTCETITQWCNRDQPPLMILAIEDNRVVGTAALKPHEMLSVFPGKTPWLGSVFVHQNYRKRGLASQLALKIVDAATAIGAKRLFLQTDRLDGGLYARLGWKPIEQVNYRSHNVLVMVKQLQQKKSAD